MKQLIVWLPIALVISGCTSGLNDEDACDEVGGYAYEAIQAMKGINEDAANVQQLTLFADRISEIGEEVGAIEIANDELAEVIQDWGTATTAMGDSLSGYDRSSASMDDYDKVANSVNSWRIANNSLIRECGLSGRLPDFNF